ncbi:MAG: TIGR02757 family protein [Deltaproteobacteria bacterium]|nr:TIGR02757 family protein [Deltaproteobacteria bacterium]
MKRSFFEKLYKSYNKHEYIHPDPLEFVYNYTEPADREIAALIASSLAYGRVAQILKSVSHVLKIMGPSPAAYLLNNSEKNIRADFAGFRHRFTSGTDKASFLIGMKRAIEKYDSLGKCFAEGYKTGDANFLPALAFFVAKIAKLAGVKKLALLPSPEDGSACKRLNLFLRWMIRDDDVDTGCWKQLPPSKLIVPLDTHMHKIGLKLKLTKRKQANLRTAVEITKAFAFVSPKDPVKYDFALTRFGIRSDMKISDILGLDK